MSPAGKYLTARWPLLALACCLVLAVLVGSALPVAVAAQTPPPPTRVDPGPGRPDPGPGRDTPVPPTTPGPVNPQPPETTPVVTPGLPVLPQTGQAVRPELWWFSLGGALFVLGGGLIIFQRRRQRS